MEGFPPVVSARIRAGGLVAASQAARGIDPPSPELAVAGIMWPAVFFGQLRERLPDLQDTVRLPDHAKITRAIRSSLKSRAGTGGIVCTLKDAEKLVRALGETMPIWYLSEEVIWEEEYDPPKPVRMAETLVDSGIRRR
jgi:tetraacyldisaccharide-1-P 4'-kinase